MTDETPPMTVLYTAPLERLTVSRWQRLKRKPWMVYLCAAIVIGYLLVALLAPWLAPHGEAEVISDQPYAPWSSEFWLGTDQIGRDVLSRLIYGTRNSVGIAVLTTLLAFAVGASLGVFAAIRGGWIDNLLSAAIETLMAIPQLILALILLAALGPSIPNIVLIIAVINATQIYRLARTTARNVVVMDFVEAARLRGEGTAWILRREILPNILPTLVAEFGLRFCFAFLTISALSFLGLGIQPPSADWGTMVREGATFISYGDITPLIPAGAIALMTLAVNVVVDHFLDPTDEHRP